MERLARLKINRPILDLQQNVRGELAVEWLQVIVGRPGAVVALLHVVNERAPDDDAVVWGESGGQHIGAVNVVAVISARAGLALAVGFDQEAAEIWNDGVYLIRLLLPPRRDFGIERIGGFPAAPLDWRWETGREIEAHAIRAKDVGEGGGPAQGFCAQDPRIMVGVICWRVRVAELTGWARAIARTRIDVFRQRLPIPQRPPRIATLDAAVEVVPMIEHAPLQPRPLAHVQFVDRLKRLHQAQEVECAVERADLAGGRDHGHR